MIKAILKVIGFFLVTIINLLVCMAGIGYISFLIDKFDFNDSLIIIAIIIFIIIFILIFKFSLLILKDGYTFQDWANSLSKKPD